MDTLKPAAKRLRASFVKALDKSKSMQKNFDQKPPIDHQNVSSQIKDMWEAYLGFTKLEF